MSSGEIDGRPRSRVTRHATALGNGMAPHIPRGRSFTVPGPRLESDGLAAAFAAELLAPESDTGAIVCSRQEGVDAERRALVLRMAAVQLGVPTELV